MKNESMNEERISPSSHPTEEEDMAAPHCNNCVSIKSPPCLLHPAVGETNLQHKMPLYR